MYGSERTLKLYFVFCIVLSSISCTTIQDITTTNPEVEPWVESGEVVLQVAPGASPLDMLHQGFESWLGQYMQANAPLDVRLAAYRVDLVEAVSDPFFAGDYEFVFRVEYSVQPVPSGSTRWLAGDGRQGQQGWIVDKLHYVGLIVDGDQATVYILGPCPMC
jgi:hypothetical protein